MHLLSRSSLVIALLLSTGCEYIPFSGSELEGSVATAPSDWSDVAQASVIRLETNPADPYSVKLWMVDLGPALYVHAGANRTTWVENIEVDPNVRLQIGEKVYELKAERVTDAATFKQFSDAYEVKYDTRPRNDNIGEVYLYRLEPRG